MFKSLAFGFQPIIEKSSPVAIHEQLVTQFAVAIASGALPSDSKLPSVRALAQRLDIHYNTVSGVYQALTQRGMVHTKKGSGVYVLPFQEATPLHHANASAHNQSTLDIMCRRFVAEAARLVEDPETLHATLETALKNAWHHHTQQTQKPWLFVDAHADILPIFIDEWNTLSTLHAEGVRVEGCTLETFPTLNLQDYQGILVNRYHHHALMSLFSEPVSPHFPIKLFDISSPQDELRLLATLPAGSLVVVVSQSQTMLNICEALLSPLSGQHLLVRCALWQDGWSEIKQAITHASVVLADLTCLPILKNNSSKPVRPIQLVPSSYASLLMS